MSLLLANERITTPELIVTAKVVLVWSGQHLEHNAQRQEAPTRSTSYFAATIEGKTNFQYIPNTKGYPTVTCTRKSP